MALKGKKPLEKAMNAKKASQTKNVKKLTTSDDAYSPERRMIKIEKETPSGGTGMTKLTTDWSNLKDETSKAKKSFTETVGRPTSVQVLGPKDFERRRRGVGSKSRGTKQKKLTDIRSISPRQPERLPKVRKKYNIGGRTNLLEELGRVEAEPSNRNRRAEISRVHRELNRGYKSGGAVLKGKKVGCQIK